MEFIEPPLNDFNEINAKQVFPKDFTKSTMQQNFTDREHRLFW